MRVAVIGGGTSGLVTLKYLLQASSQLSLDDDIEVRLFESSSKIGGIFHHHVYEAAELVSSKFLTAFSDFRPARDDPDFLSAERYLEYLHQYADAFDLWPHIHLSTKVEAVRRGRNGVGHVVTYRPASRGGDATNNHGEGDGEVNGEAVEWECDAIAVCSGLHDVPNVPHLEGVDNVPLVMHSAEFKHSSQFGVDKTVMILGSGETSMDLCALAIQAPTKQVVLCHRNGWFGAPKRLANTRVLPSIWKIPDDEKTTFPKSSLPIDVSHLSLFDTSYVHPVVRDSMIVWDHYDSIAVGSAWISTAATLGFDQFVGGVPPEKLHASRLFFNKAWTKVSNYISPDYRPQGPSTFGEYVRSFLVDTPRESADRRIDVAPFPSRIDGDGVAHFADNGSQEYHRIKDKTIKPDVVVFATGYLQSFSFFDSNRTNSTNNSDKKTPSGTGKPYPHANEADVREIWKRDDPTVAFIGFVRPGFGAIPPLSELQAMLWILNLHGRITKPLLPKDQWHYRIIAPPQARITYGVEHDSYAFQLADDMDATPGVVDIARLSIAQKNVSVWRLPYIWAAAPNFTVKFRLVGPWAFAGAVDVMTGDLWEVIARRKGVFGNFTLFILPAIQLGLVQLFYLVYGLLVNALASVGLAKPLRPVRSRNGGLRS